MKLGVINNALVVKFIGDVDNLVCSPYKTKLETVINENKYKKVIPDSCVTKKNSYICKKYSWYEKVD